MQGAYQLYRFTFTGGLGLIFLSAVVIFLTALIWPEYRAQPRHHTTVL